ncbi:hypothetical protein C8R44DRAFT_882060 [Mycena epipterygia]|nr:hypothetical protein C8R44DRAFT_882060 [Mycena epipterygia]
MAGNSVVHVNAVEAMSFIVLKEFSPEANVFPRRILHLLDVLKTGLSRSGSCPLSIQLDHPTQEISLSPFHGMLLPHFSRVEHLPISHTLDPAGHRARPASASRRCYFRNGVSSLVTAFLQAPRLHTIILADMRSQKIELPWCQLTTLVLESIYNHECAAILEHVVSLIHCRVIVANHSVRPGGLTLIRPYTSGIAGTRPLYTSMLHDAVTHLLNTLTLPALRKLKIQEEGVVTFNAIASLVSRSGCPLETLHVVQGS